MRARFREQTVGRTEHIDGTAGGFGVNPEGKWGVNSRQFSGPLRLDFLVSHLYCPYGV